ncbi:GerAB/ArcD/ProY family transporter [Bacillus tuaregi]|uniref:GerAB/ArcD/ProY family transporter n=1 Tax=Bacillus tuaregi TaxID=1816695 RepID=UPI0008F85FF4|nr:endospore germination permease [Bacillus tuaregi]
MNKHREFSITPVQLATIVISSTLGVEILALPRFVVKGAGLGAPIASIVGVTIAFFGLLAVVLLGRKFPRQTFIGYSEDIIGKPLGSFVSALMIIFFVIMTGLETRQYAEIVAGSLLPNTPVHIAIFLMLLLCATIGFQHVATFAYIHFFYMPLILFPIIMVLIPGFQDIEIYHLTPILGNDPTFKGFLSGGIVVTQSVLNFFVIAMVIPFMKEPNKCVKSGIWGFWIACFFVVFIISMSLAVFGEEEIQQSFWPVLVLGRMIHIPSQILSRIDAVLLISWIYGTFTTLLSFYFVVVRGMSELIHSERYRLISFIGFPIMFFIALLPQNIYQMYNYILHVTRYGIVITIMYPILLLFIAFLRKKGGESV